MKIDYLKINGFGNLENKEINLEPKINIIYGKNESGKSSLVKFITNMLYGSSKNKNGRNISDFDKFKPWNTENFSGKIKYTLDSNDEFEIYREFKKKSPQIYNSKLEEITEQYTIDKTKGSQFFYEQTGIDENVFTNTAISMQEETKLDPNSQNLLLQKISNLVSTGKDDVSYKKVYEKINKKLVEEVGNDRTTGRPLNIVNEKIIKLKQEIEELKESKEESENIKQEKVQIEIELQEKEIIFDLLKEVKTYKNEEKIHEKEIELLEKAIDESEEKLKNIKFEKINNTNNNNNEKKKIKIFPLLSILLIIISIVLFLINVPKPISIAGMATGIILVLINILISYKNIKKKNLERFEIEKNNLLYEKEIEILQDTISKQVYKNNNLKEQISQKKSKHIVDIKNKYIDKVDEYTLHEIINDSNIDLEKTINRVEKEINEQKIRLNTLNISLKLIEEKLEKYINYQEELEESFEEKEKLEFLESSILLSKEILNNAYEKVKQEISPIFTYNLSNAMSRISNGKYNKVIINDKEGIKVEGIDGAYIPAERLSVGTIDELYLSLRISALNEISKEKLPIILDETFAYFDNDRLENILKYINENFENQIIIMTCSNREKQILENLRFNYHYIEI